MLHEQRDQLRAALDQLRAANAALAANAAAAGGRRRCCAGRQLARAMHDDIGHALVVMNVKLEAAQL
jgi:signal transduction histidine kinase